jgi:hypothetical protein
VAGLRAPTIVPVLGAPIAAAAVAIAPAVPVVAEVGTAAPAPAGAAARRFWCWLRAPRPPLGYWALGFICGRLCGGS